MELTYAFLYDQKAKQALNKLSGIPMHGKIVSNLVLMRKELETEFKALKKEFEALVKKHSELNEKGEVNQPDGPDSFIVKPESTKDFNKEVEELFAKKFEIKASKFPHQVLLDRNIEMSAIDVEALAPILFYEPEKPAPLTPVK